MHASAKIFRGSLVTWLLLTTGYVAPTPAPPRENARPASDVVVQYQVQEPQGTVLYFPDYVEGDGWSVQLVLSNTGAAAATAVIEVYAPDGQSVTDLFDSGSRLEIPGLGSRVLRSSGEGAIRRGWIDVRTDTNSVSALLTYRHFETGIEVGVQPIEPGSQFAFSVEETSEIGTGLAIFKPEGPSEIEFRIRDEEGRDPIRKILRWGDFQQWARTLPEWFENTDTKFLRDFRGLLFLRAVDRSDFTPLGLRFGKQKGSLSAVPVIPIRDAGVGKMYWVDWDTAKIQRANLDGSGVEDLVTSGLREPFGLALDLGAGKMYWTDIGTAKIQRANLDGSGVEDLVTSGLGEPVDLELDLGAGKMYWPDWDTAKIQRANLDGSGVEDLVTGIHGPASLALDVGGGKLYWADVGTDLDFLEGVEKIQRANLDGSGVEDLVTGLVVPISLALGSDKLYWTDIGTAKIQRANLDGSGVEDLVTGLNLPIGLALGGDKLYWGESGTDLESIDGGEKIRRANLDGSGVEDLVTSGLGQPADLELDLAGNYQIKDPQGTVLYFPDYVEGGGWSVQLVLSNISAAAATAVVEVYGQDGQLVTNLFDSGSTLEIPSLGSRVLRSTGGGTIRRGWIEVRADTQTVSGLLTYGHTQTGIEVGVQPIEPGSQFALFVEETSEIGTGLAILKPLVFNPGAPTGREIEFEIRDEEGNDPVGEALIWGGFHQQALTLPEWFDRVDTGFLTNFRGLLFLRSTDGSEFVPLGLRFGKQKGSLSAVPVIPIRDAGAGKMYWTDLTSGKIQRASLDGSGVEELVTRPPGVRRPYGLALDLDAGKMYWTDVGTVEIQRANLDGSGVEDLVTSGLRQPTALALDSGAGKMYWTDEGTSKIQRANLDGSGVEDLVTSGLHLHRGLALDLGAGKMYWTDWGTDKIQRANLDGSGVEDLITSGLDAPGGLALDLGVGKMYWTDWGTSKIQRANLDGSGVEDLVTSELISPSGLALDLGTGKVYWMDRSTRKIQRANLDGSGVEDLVTSGLLSPEGLALDPGSGRGISPDPIPPTVRLSVAPTSIEQGRSATLTWSSTNAVSATITPGIGAVPTSGSRNVSPAVTTTYRLTVRNATGQTASATATVTVNEPPDLVVETPSVSVSTLTTGQSFDFSATVLNRGGSQSAATTLRYYRSNNTTISTDDTPVGTDAVRALSASGTSAESIQLTAPSSAGTYYYGACVDPVSGESRTGNNCSQSVRVTVSGGSNGAGKMYWTEFERDDIRRANLDGSGVEGLVTSGLDAPMALALGGGKMYWTEAVGEKIRRANLDGSGVEDLLTSGLGLPAGLALDLDAGKMYWTDWWTRKIQRANLDGSGVEDLVTSGLSGPRGIALDLDAGKMYWTVDGSDKIQRANLDGSGVEDLVTSGLSGPYGIALDLGAGKMYWTNWWTGKIQRANLDGSGVEDLVTVVFPTGLALDLGGN